MSVGKRVERSGRRMDEKMFDSAAGLRQEGLPVG